MSFQPAMPMIELNNSVHRSIFEHPSKLYESYQENGTKYIKSRKQLDEHLLDKLNACAGEIFLCCIPADVSAEQIAEIASQFGEIYVLRFKVTFSGESRGFSYLQYMDPSLMSLALTRLPLLFRKHSLPMIRVCQSRNNSVLIMRGVHIPTNLVCEYLQSLINFYYLDKREVYPGHFEYRIIFKCNEQAVHGRRELLRAISNFGSKATVMWENNFTPYLIQRSNQKQRHSNGSARYVNNHIQYI
ncbi:tumorous testis [Haematobia irritans]|uniref:tumorous testis n=1 Tax=Haematobia irritans TaxID=7368 RepID=UPI003F50589F